MTKLTNKNILKNSTTLIAITVTVILSVATTNAFATHYYSGQKWDVTSVDACYSTSLENLNINGHTGQFNTAASQIDGARSDWNDEPSVWTFNKVTTSCGYWFSATSLGPDVPIATTNIFPPTSGTITNADTSINKDYTYTTTNTCSMPTFYLQYIATHELGHWLKLNHSPDPPEQSVMFEFANCAGTTVKAHDSSSLTSIYG